MSLYVPNGGALGVSDRLGAVIDQYIQEYGLETAEIARNSGIINNMLLYAYDLEIKPNISEYSDIESIDKLFNFYVSLCFQFEIKPSINVFLSWLHISKRIFTCLCNGDRSIYISEKGLFIYNIKEFRILYPKEKYIILNNNNSIVSSICLRWKEVCESAVIDGILNTRGNPAGLIFCAKSVFGYSETGGRSDSVERVEVRTADAIASDYGRLDDIGGSNNGDRSDQTADSDTDILQLPTP